MRRAYVLLGVIPTLVLGVAILAGEACESRRRAELARCLRENPTLPYATCAAAAQTWFWGGMRR